MQSRNTLVLMTEGELKRKSWGFEVEAKADKLSMFKDEGVS